MAIDPKELRIGSHVEYNDERCIVVGVADFGGVLRSGVALKVDSEVMLNTDPNLINPILLTPELRTELGFVNTSSTRRIVYTKGCEYDGMWIEVKTLKDRWEAFVSDNDWDGRTVVRYLHELESFLYLATKQELINN